jgi:hypothetical protein
MPGFSLPVMCVADDSYPAAVKVHQVSPSIAPDNERKIARALGLFESHIDGKAFREKIAAFQLKMFLEPVCCQVCGFRQPRIFKHLEMSYRQSR